MKTTTLLLFSALASASMLLSAQGAIVINEVFVNPVGTDNGQEYFELRSTLSGVESMNGLTLLIIEGDGAAPGVIDAAYNLSSFSTGSNGLFLWRDAATTINPAPHSATIVNVADFTPDMENGSNTFLIVSGFTGTLAQDLDTDNDGTLDVLPWTSVNDAVGFVENDGASNVAYATQFGGTNLGPDAGFNADLFLRDSVSGLWLFGDVLGTNPGGPYTFDVTPGRTNFGATGTEGGSPGNTNFTVVPEPTQALYLGIATLGLMIRRRTK